MSKSIVFIIMLLSLGGFACKGDGSSGSTPPMLDPPASTPPESTQSSTLSEYRPVATKAVSTWYQEYLSRLPESAGLNLYVGKLLSGTSCEEVANGFLNALSFQGEGGDTFTNREFITRVYKAFLQQDVADGSFQNALSYLGEGGSRSAWFQKVVYSASFQSLDVCNIPFIPAKNIKLEEEPYYCESLLRANNNEGIDAGAILKNCIIIADGRWVDIPAGVYFLRKQFVEPEERLHIALKTRGKNFQDEPCMVDDASCAQFIGHSR